jgi:hypothetical protein
MTYSLKVKQVCAVHELNEVHLIPDSERFPITVVIGPETKSSPHFILFI